MQPQAAFHDTFVHHNSILLIWKDLEFFQRMVAISKEYATVTTEINSWRGNWTFVPQYEFINWTTKVYAIKRGVIYFSSLTQPSPSCQSKIQVGIFCLSCQSSSRLVYERLMLIFVACVCSFVLLLTFYNNPFCLANRGQAYEYLCHVLLLCHCFSFINKWHRKMLLNFVYKSSVLPPLCKALFLKHLKIGLWRSKSVW